MTPADLAAVLTGAALGLAGLLCLVCRILAGPEDEAARRQRLAAWQAWDEWKRREIEDGK